MIAALIIIGIFSALWLLIWMRFNYSESKSINKRWGELLEKEKEKENTFKRINKVVVNKHDGSRDVIEGARSWDKDKRFFYIKNNEAYVIALYNLDEIKDVKFVRNEVATYEPSN